VGEHLLPPSAYDLAAWHFHPLPSRNCRRYNLAHRDQALPQNVTSGLPRAPHQSGCAYCSKRNETGATSENTSSTHSGDKVEEKGGAVR
jgi:hypothetical protein